MATTGQAAPPAAKEAPVEKVQPPDAETIAALKQALEDLFADQAVVTMRDVRLWLQSYTANMKARAATLQTDSTLSSLLLGGGDVLEIRFVASNVCGHAVGWICACLNIMRRCHLEKEAILHASSADIPCRA